ncbi:MAG: Asp-tRNA(Asn)/Glu-tRNA(Gln) amidotransferase subunit GatC [Dehalococcoidia bacterium]|jgi:aspartyl-tRNA(Asn)/glutamyl-tRNA(Gln) amidotransferase subunit C|nr:Asp-tRNA(Asn)/Glu-tRNA(Gln) amidotransferase subunit GatC [Dehalococcoidia bacterium]MDP7469826.1 Asp-tRNA(Asn)/Glu-tRNA(Gln) amidotransferase subunit GatC [Dehalococcoidia bacterium]
MSLTQEEVRHIANLARLGIGLQDVERMREQLSSILEHFQLLQALDTTEIPPTVHVVPLHTVQREDLPADSFSPDDIMANAPRPEEGYFRVQVVLEE